MFSLKKLKAVIGNKNASEDSHDSEFTDKIIKEVEGAPFAISQSNVMYAGTSELAGYHYFKTVIIGTLKLKTLNGATLIVKSDHGQLKLKSDMVELESEIEKGSNRVITRIDFEIDQEDLGKISRKSIQSLELISKKNHLHFSVLELTENLEEEE